jgi:tetratricopeptide (TPR) repeat protein
MKLKLRFIEVLICFLVFFTLTAQAATNTDKQRKLAEQKLKLVEMLVNSPAAKKKFVDSDADAADLIESGRTLITSARNHMGEGEYTQALQALDEALRQISRANKKRSGELSVSAQEKRLREMGERVASYRESMVELVHNEKIAEAAQSLLENVDALVNEANQLAAANRWGEANKKMAAAYKLEVEEISRLREGEEVLITLNFETPADEYAYEQKRFDSNMILVNMKMDEGSPSSRQRRLVDGFVSKANSLKTEAEAHAVASDYKDAIQLMEQAAKQLNRALSSMGIPVY